MSIKAFIFDCGGVLLRDDDRSAYRRWEVRLGLPEGEIAKCLWSGAAWDAAEHGKLTDQEFLRQACATFGLVDAALVAELDQDLWDSFKLDEKVLALIDRIRATHPVALLSNASDALEGMLAERYHVADRFVTIVNSARVGLAKPERGIYEETLKRLGVAAHEVVFIDDRAENIAAAAALGMHVVWYVQADELTRKIEGYLNHNGFEINTKAPSHEGAKAKETGESEK